MDRKKFIAILVVFFLTFHIPFVNLLQTYGPAKYIDKRYGSVYRSYLQVNNVIYDSLMDKLSYPYHFANSPYSKCTRYYVPYDYYTDYFLPWDSILRLDEYDEYFFWDNYPHYDVYVKEDFVFPTLESNEIDEVWMSLLSDGKYNIKDKETVSKIVECAKSEGEIELDQEIVDYIKKYSWDNHCFCLKYKGYPLVEEFHIEETEDGRYVVDQFTEEEYTTIYYDDELHYQ